MTLFLILGAFLLGLLIGSVWGWREGYKQAIRDVQPLFETGARNATDFMAAQRDAAREGRQ